MYTKKFEATTYAVFNSATCGNYGAMIQFFSNSQAGLQCAKQHCVWGKDS
jgi:hypothetical protein